MDPARQGQHTREVRRDVDAGNVPPAAPVKQEPAPAGTTPATAVGTVGAPARPGATVPPDATLRSTGGTAPPASNVGTGGTTNAGTAQGTTGKSEGSTGSSGGQS
jgi:hypothetical protein